MGPETSTHVGNTPAQFELRPFSPPDYGAVRELFIRVNRELAPQRLRDAFEKYIEISLAEEIDRITDYYDQTRQRSFWVAYEGERLLGFFGLEPANDRDIELRRMYVDPSFRRRGVARRMLTLAENIAKRQGFEAIVLSTSEIQRAALSLYCNSDYVLVREESAVSTSNKTVGGGIRRFHFRKQL